MNEKRRFTLIKTLAVIPLTTLLALGASSEALARGDRDGHRIHDRGHHYGQRRHQGHHHWKGGHRYHYRYPGYRYPRHSHYRHYGYGYPYELFGLGLLTGYLLDDYHYDYD